MVLVSIIMPAHNAEEHIESSINSVMLQTYQNFELLVIDDCSQDQTVNLVRGYQDERVKVIELKENVGVAAARNQGLKQALGKYVAFLDSDDLWKVDKLEKQIQFMEDRELALSYTAYEVIDAAGEKVTGRVTIPENISYRQLLKNTIIGCLTVIIDIEKTGKIEMPNLGGAEDTATWLSILREGHKVAGLTESLAYYRKGNTSSLSNNKLHMAKQIWLVYRENQKLSFLQSLIYFPCYVWNGFFKHLRTGGSVKTIR
ncbi:glycosyltransferase family 2 protein [Listeria sp. ILCC792]|uniref:glycosyltransferase family 2 protein n=1 Tax=Listeria sp. ILCC792 TaxID=1918331 RepID=UPI000B5890B1|nr:glycosyltransferase family 2 protein [Listeria sp. ILCC792]